MTPAEAKELAIQATEGKTLLERQLAASRLLVALTRSLDILDRLATGSGVHGCDDFCETDPCMCCEARALTEPAS